MTICFGCFFLFVVYLYAKTKLISYIDVQVGFILNSYYLLNNRFICHNVTRFFKVKMEHEPPISTSSPLTSPSPVPPVASPSPQHPLPSPSTSKPLSSLSISLPNPSTSQPQPSPSKEPLLLSPSKDPHSLLNQTLPVRTAASR